MAVQIQSRRDTAANWTSNDPTLAAGEIGFETDTGKVKVGDGATAWTALDYLADASLLDNSMADALHRHSELSASDGAPDQALTVDANGRVNITNDFSVDSDLLFVDIAGNVGVGIGTGTPSEMLDVVGNAEINGNIIVTGSVDGIDIATDVAANTTKTSYTKTNVKGHVFHDSTAGTSRASGFTSVEWVGSVEPTNAVNGDTWIDTT